MRSPITSVSGRCWLAAVVTLAGIVALGATQARSARPIRIVTSSTDLAHIASEVGRDRVETHSFFAGDQEPELWVEEVFPSWVVRSIRAQAFARIGLYADVWADTVLESAQNRGIVPGAPGYLDASVGIDVLEVPPGRVDRSLGEIHVAGNPHYLLDPLNGKIVVDNVARALARISPDDADDFRRNAADFKRRIDQAMSRWEEMAKAVRGKKIAAYHKTWSYFVRRFGIVVVGYCEPKPGIEPSPADVRALVEAMAHEGARVIIHEPVYSPRIPQAVAREVQRITGQPVTVLLLPSHVGGVPEATDYFALFDYLLTALGSALR